MNNNEKYLEMDILPVQMTKHIKGDISELDSCKIYKVLANGTIQESSGVMTNNAFLFYDITNTTPEFKAGCMDMSMKGIQNILPPVEENQQSVELLNTEGSYSSLNKEEKASLGYNFVTLANRENGLDVQPVLIQRRADNLYVQIDSTTLDSELLAKVGSDITVLNLNEYGLYEEATKEVSPKSL